MLYPIKDDVKKLLEKYTVVPVFYEMLIDSATPVRLFVSLKEKYNNCFILESVDNAEQWGRYSFIGINPKTEIKVIGDTAQIITDGNIKTIPYKNPVELFSGILDNYKSPVFSDRPKLTGGLMGYFGYDTIRSIENKLTDIPYDDINMPDANMFLYDEIVAYDHLTNKAIIILNIHADNDLDMMYEQCIKKTYEIADVLNNQPSSATADESKNAEIKVNSSVTKDEFINMVNTAKQHIVDGDISQVVLSQRFEIDNPPSPFNVYRMLRSTNPSPYLYYFENDDYKVAGASPEKLVSVTDRTVYTRPIAGTIRRGVTPSEDKMLENRLLNDEKERAEHTMLVDLGRNDIGRVCKFGTVKVTDFMHVERYSQVMHLVSDVEGTLRDDKTALDALMSVLPAGTLSGAPKVKAMQIIDSLEKNKRGLYGGMVGYFTFTGNIDTCIAIRTVLFKNDKAYIQAGAGIVNDSDPESEYEETKKKALAVVNAITEALKI